MQGVYIYHICLQEGLCRWRLYIQSRIHTLKDDLALFHNVIYKVSIVLIVNCCQIHISDSGLGAVLYIDQSSPHSYQQRCGTLYIRLIRDLEHMLVVGKAGELHRIKLMRLIGYITCSITQLQYLQYIGIERLRMAFIYYMKNYLYEEEWEGE